MDPREFSSDWILEQTRRNNEIDWSQDPYPDPEEETDEDDNSYDWDGSFGEEEF